MKKFALALMVLLLAATLCSCSSGKEEDGAPAAKSEMTAAQKAKNKEPEIVEGAEHIQSRENPYVYYMPMTDGTVAVGCEAHEEKLDIPETVDGYKVSTLVRVADAEDKLAQLTIPNGVVRIFGCPFYECPELEEVIIASNHPTMKVRDGMLLSRDGKKLLTVVNAGRTSYVIPEGVQMIGEGAFIGCENMVSVTFPESLTSIGNSVFAYTGLETVEIPRTVTELGINPFRGCSELKSIRVAQDHPTLAVIDGVLFRKEGKELICYPAGRGETSYAIPDRILKIGDFAFEGSGLEEIAIPASVTSIGDYAFYNCSSLTSITIPDSVTVIGDYAFYYCTSLTSITIPDSVTAIGDWAFSGCGSLTSITIPDSVTAIGNYAFYWCTSLTSITIPDGVTTIGDYAFYYCTSLISITIPDSVTAIGKNPFCSCAELTDIIVSPEHPTLATIDGVLFDKVEKTLICYPYAYTNSSYAIPQGIRVIGDSAFFDCTSLTSITIPDSVTAIGDEAFYWCDSLTSITIPESVTSIGDYAFRWCSSLTSLFIPNSVTSIGTGAFDSCYSLTLTVNSGSYAQRYCEENGLQYTCPDALDWLYN